MIHPVDWENETVHQVSERAARRAIEAISRVGTFQSRLTDVEVRNGANEAEIEQLRHRVATLEDVIADLATIIEDYLKPKKSALGDSGRVS